MGAQWRIVNPLCQPRAAEADEPAEQGIGGERQRRGPDANVEIAARETLHLLDVAAASSQGGLYTIAPANGAATKRADVGGTVLRVAHALHARGVVGRFSTFLEHVKPLQTGERVTKFNALFHWAVPHGREIEAGQQVGRFHILTHCYWREGGPEFRNVNIMAVAHGTEKPAVLAHKAAIDAHLAEAGIPVISTIVISMHTFPMTLARLPWMSTCPAPRLNARLKPSA